MSTTALFEAAIGPFGLLIVLLAFLLAVGSGKFYVPRGAHDREVQRVDRYDEIVQTALSTTSQTLEQQQRVFADHEKLIQQQQQILENQRLVMERQGWEKAR